MPVDALDFDSNRNRHHTRVGSPDSNLSRLSDGAQEGLLGEAADGILELDRETLRRETRRYVSYASAILSS